jgi:hypothetical protein
MHDCVMPTKGDCEDARQCLHCMADILTGAPGGTVPLFTAGVVGGPGLGDSGAGG